MADRPTLKPWHLAALLVAFHVWYSGRLPLVPDEAYYWVWSRQLAWGYFDHPPMIAGLIALGTALAGDTEAGVRLLPVVLGIVPLLVAMDLSRDKLLGVALLGTVPLFCLGGLLATPDAPLVAAWAGAIWARCRGWWWFVGVCCGLAMLSKYTGALLLPCLVLARPGDLRTAGPWLAAGIAAALFAPNVWWNAQHDWVSYTFQLKHVAGGAGQIPFLLAQVALGGFVAFAAFVAFWVKGIRGDEVDRVLWWSSLPLLVVAILAGGEANWAAPAYVGAAIGVARMEGRWWRVGWQGVGLSAALSALVLIHAEQPLFFHEKDPLHRLRGGDVLADSVAAWGIPHVYTVRYQEAALIHFYGDVPARALPGLDRPDQYDLWAEPLAGRALFVRGYRGDAPLQVADRWDQHGPGNIVVAHAETDNPVASRPVHSWQVYLVWDE